MQIRPCLESSVTTFNATSSAMFLQEGHGTEPEPLNRTAGTGDCMEAQKTALKPELLEPEPRFGVWFWGCFPATLSLAVCLQPLQPPPTSRQQTSLKHIKHRPPATSQTPPLAVCLLTTHLPATCRSAAVCCYQNSDVVRDYSCRDPACRHPVPEMQGGPVLRAHQIHIFQRQPPSPITIA